MATHVLITGGAGYLGSIICEHLLARGFRVTVVDKLLYNQHSLFHFCANPLFDFVYGDVRDESLMRRLMAAADVIFPLAALVGAKVCEQDPWTAVSVNRDAISQLMKIKSPDQLVVYPTTNSGYGTKSGDLFCTEETPLEPISIYGKSKVEAEAAVMEAPRTITLRLATVFGLSPRFRLDLLVNHFTYAAVTDRYIVLFEKHFKHNYVHIRDVADCFLFCLDNADRLIGRTFNVGLTDANLTKEELALKIREHVPEFTVMCAEIGSDPDKRNYIVSHERLKKEGFSAQRSLDDGIRELLKGFRMFGRHPFQNA
ncbi:MAG TPA: NAD(P)-dependent oxidoreductase [Candidatus Ozemobacteraceae bacterium]|nr:NAD(P)-dependent oxidoreductase [Candidatus Ozemobacteraceae bacterium]